MRRRIKGLLKTTKRGLTSLFVFGVVLLPIMPLLHVTSNFTRAGARQVSALPAFSARSQDKTGPLKPFSEPIVTITFDDGWGSTYTDAAPLLQKYGIHTTQYVLSGTLKDPKYMSSKQLLSLQAAGHDIACHSVSHADLTMLDQRHLTHELKDCQTFYAKLTHKPVLDFASPYGSYNDSTIAATSQYYRSQRNTNGDITNGVTDADVNLPESFDQYNIISFAIRDNTSIDELRQAVDYTIAHNGWLVLTYHQLEGDTTFGIDKHKLEQQFAFLSASAVRIAPVGAVLDALPSNQKVEY